MTMRKKNSRAVPIAHPRQLQLFGDLASDDPVLTYYRRCRRAGLTLSYAVSENQIRIYASGVIPAWASRLAIEHGERLREDLLRVEHGIDPPRDVRKLDGGAVLHHLPARRWPEHDPPVRSRAVPNRSRGPGAA